jgi:hypothetical protein
MIAASIEHWMVHRMPHSELSSHAWLWSSGSKHTEKSRVFWCFSKSDICPHHQAPFQDRRDTAASPGVLKYGASIGGSEMSIAAVVQKL